MSKDSINGCLLIVDVQKGFINKNTEEIPGRIKHLLKNNKFDYVIGTRFINGPITNNYHTLLSWHKMNSEPEIDICSEINNLEMVVFNKNTYNAATNELLDYLYKNNIKNVYICGLDTDACIYSTALTLFDIGYHPIILSKYCGSGAGSILHCAALEMLKRNIGKQNVIDEL